MASETTKPIGTVGVPALLCALTGSVLAVSMEWMGFLNEVTASLTQFWQKEPFFLVDPELVSREWNWLATFLASWLVAYFTLSSARLWRRLLVGMMAGLLLVGFMPSLALWGILWLPVVSGISVLWTWACASLYAGQHAMPSEAVVTVIEPVGMKVETIPFPTKKNTK
jgi:hypothetical protein